jgi:hypothetical protein
VRDEDGCTTAPAVTTDATDATTDLMAAYLASLAWRDRARCREVSHDAFYPGRGDVDRLAAAREFCAGCVVRVECLDYALRAGERFGVWGGTSERERRRSRATPCVVNTARDERDRAPRT